MMICALLAVFSSRCAPFLAAKEEKKRERKSRESRFSPTLSFKRNKSPNAKSAQRNLKRVRVSWSFLKCFMALFALFCKKNRKCDFFQKTLLFS